MGKVDADWYNGCAAQKNFMIELYSESYHWVAVIQMHMQTHVSSPAVLDLIN